MSKIKVLFFHAYWCKSCKKMEDVFSEVEESFKEDKNVTFESVDVESENGVKLSCRYEVRNVPAIVIVNERNVVEKLLGKKSSEELKTIIEKWK